MIHSIFFFFLILIALLAAVCVVFLFLFPNIIKETPKISPTEIAVFLLFVMVFLFLIASYHGWRYEAFYAGHNISYLEYMVLFSK